MPEKEKTEKILTLGEVKEMLEKCKDLPLEIYSGPEKDNPIDIEEEPAPLVEGAPVPPKKEVLHELSFEKRAAIEHVSTFSRIEKDKALKMIKELKKIERVSEVHAFKISEILPRDESELRPVFAKDRFTLEPEELKTILEVINKYRA
jgi:DNA-directed RNA polymerase subunit F